MTYLLLSDERCFRSAGSTESSARAVRVSPGFFRSGRGPASRGDKHELTPSTWCVQEFRSRTTTPCSHRHLWNAHMRTNCGLTERESQARATATTGDHPH